ncbi:MAG TPA: DMT family transporter [Albitalea sp.]
MTPGAGPPLLRTLLLTAAAMAAFAANSLLTRLALQAGSIDAASFSSIRLVSGALALVVIVRLRAPHAPPPGRPDGLAAAMLFAYVIGFSLAYLSLTAGTGALILFGAVQLTMCVAGWRAGERFGPLAALGFAAAVAGLVALVLPGVAAPEPLGALSMAVAGIAWGGYSLRGRGAADPLAATAANFMGAAPMALAVSVLLYKSAHVSPDGVALAIASGAITSGVGYVIWYAALRGLTALRAAAVQLSVPPLAAFGGVLLLDEAITPRLLGASVAILGGIGLVLAERQRKVQARSA